jgi:hypothetical protein
VTISTSAGFSCTDAQASVAFGCLLDRFGYSVCASAKTHAPRSDDLRRAGQGSYMISVLATDGAGNIARGAVCSWTLAFESGASFTIGARARHVGTRGRRLNRSR